NTVRCCLCIHESASLALVIPWMDSLSPQAYKLLVETAEAIVAHNSHTNPEYRKETPQ
ncbi:unnamed protein product, partial [marine sediment metagenome]